VKSETPEREDAQPAAGWVLYDGECRFCQAAVARFHISLGKRGYAFLPLQTPWVRKRLGLGEGEIPAEMVVLTPDDQTFGGADAVLHLARSYGWARLFLPLMRLPGARRLCQTLYRKVAANRHCLGGACQIPASPPPSETHRKP